MNKTIKLKINQTKIEVEKDSTLLSAANQSGTQIPTLCHLHNGTHFTSCMLCVVQDMKTGKIVPSCSVRAENGMEIETDNDKVHTARKTALELLLSEHVGDCEGPCQRGCPANMNIPKMIRQIKAEEYDKALITVKEHIALPAVLGRICKAPCENICRRKQIDHTISICELKQFVADINLQSSNPYIPKCKANTRKKIAIIGAGPTGLSAAYYLRQQGHSCTIFDNNAELGGMLRYGVPDNILPKNILDAEIEIIRKLEIKTKLNNKIGEDTALKSVITKHDAVIIATNGIKTDELEKSDIKFSNQNIIINSKTFETNIPGIFAGGSAIRPVKMAVRSVAQGRSMAISVNQYLNKETITGVQLRFNSKIGKLQLDEYKEFIEEETQNSNINPTEYNKNETGLSPEQAIAESERCLSCDCLKPENCKLRDYVDEYNTSAQTFKSSERKKIERYYHHSDVVYEPGKCIKCGLCVRITKNHGERLGLTFIGRGFDVRVGVPLNESLDKGLEKTATECVEACPTGALAFKK